MSKIQFMILVPVIFLGLTIVSCTNNSPLEDSKEHAEEINEETLGKSAEEDAEHLVELYGANLYEVQSSEEALNRASSNDVKQLATMMVQAHSKILADIKQMADKRQIILPGELSNDKMRDLDNLLDKTGLDFDKEYLEQMENKHEDAIDELEKTAADALDPELKTWASQSIPQVRSHLDMVLATKNSIKDMKSEARQAEQEI